MPVVECGYVPFFADVLSISSCILLFFRSLQGQTYVTRLMTLCAAVTAMRRDRPPAADDTSEQRWNYADRGKPKHSEKNVSQGHFVPQKSTWTDVGTNPAVRNEKLATNSTAPAHTDCAVTKYIYCISLNIEHIKEVK
jgi:hypothetical protein